MPVKRHSYPYRTGYRSDLEYPRKGFGVIPSHGSGPRCRVDYNPNDEGPWAMLHIMRIENVDMAVEPEQFTCVMPRCYAIPLMLVNKRLAFTEAQCRPDGTPLAPDSEDSSEDTEDSSTSKRKSVATWAHELCEYTYLWRLRTRFLQAVFEMNYVRLLDEQWRYVGLHGFLHRMYGRYGHDRQQRFAYWRDQIKEGRAPYSKPDIAEMDWAAYLREETTAEASTRIRIDGFLWGHMSQGYDRVVQDKPPHESWRVWRTGGGRSPARHQDDASQLLALYRTPGSSPGPSSAHEMPHGPRTEPSPEGSNACQDVEDEVGAAALWAASAAAPAAAEEGAFSPGSSGDAVAGGQRCGAVDEDEDVLRAALTGPPHSQEWVLPFPRAEPSSQSSPGASSDQAGTAAGTRSSSPGRLRPIQISFRMNAPENLELTDIQCTFTPVEDMTEDFPGTTLRVAYASKMS